jgi:hypothetical protein
MLRLIQRRCIDRTGTQNLEFKCFRLDHMIVSKELAWRHHSTSAPHKAGDRITGLYIPLIESFSKQNNFISKHKRRSAYFY